MDSLEEKLINKSTEAFILGLEIYNKPTIKYRIEGFSFLVCNAWELMLKSHLCKTRGQKSIYFKDSFDRTISLEKCIELVFTNNKDPLRINLEKILSLRNISTHFITEDYESVYAPLFQACVLNFTNKLMDFHSIDITIHIPQNFLTLSAKISALTDEQIRIKYTPELAEKLIIDRNEVELLSKEHNDRFSINIKQNFYITKNEKDSDFKISVSRDAEAKGKIIKEIQNPGNTHKYSFNHLVKEVNKQLKRYEIPFSHSSKDNKRDNFNRNDLLLFIDFYDMKGKKQFAFKHIIGNSSRYSYSFQAANFIVEEIKKNPDNIITHINNAKK